MKITAALLSLLIVLTIFPSFKVKAITFTPSFAVSSDAAVLINLDKDVVIYEKNPTKKMYPASLTKLMTAIVVLDHVKDLDNTYFEAPLVVFDELFGKGASNVGLSRGEITTATDLMYSMLMHSACESASILAYHVGGNSIPNFINMMNEKAVEIGCTGTNFANAHGLYDDNQYTNAWDMALITKYAVENYPKLVEIASTVEYRMKATNYRSEDGWVTIYHTNRMLMKNSEYYYQHSKGLKTGTLDQAGRCLAALASRDGNNYLLVTMNSPLVDENGNAVNYHYDDHRNIFEWAFETFAYQKLVSVTEEITEVSVKLGQDRDHVLLLPAEDYSALWPLTLDASALRKDIVTYTDDDGAVIAPIARGQVLGALTLSLSGETICEVDLVAKESIERSQLEYSFLKAKEFINSSWFKFAIGIAVTLIVLYVTLLILANKKRKQKIKKVTKSRRF
ncbi:MAG: D-alanyl-D-alanine carboxypeptidase [Oscillospiraceae bacterium]|nr:D-alanyl-D-alanine carboxypeptidase [Oscillospiraceae bacterium]